MTEYDVRQMKQVALVMALTANLNADVAGMVAENARQEQLGNTPPHGEAQFAKVVEDSGIWGWNGILDLLNV